VSGLRANWSLNGPWARRALHGLRRLMGGRRGLLVVTAGGAMAEAAVLAVLAPAARALAPQATALAPLAIYHDLRWLYGYGLPWPAFAALAVALLVARSVVSATLVRLAWPAGSPPPPLRALLWPALTLTAFAGLLLSPVVSLMFGAAVVPFSWPYLASLSAMVRVGIPISHGGVRRTWWETLPPMATVGWLLADFAVLTVAAAVTTRLPPAAAVPVAGLAGLVNARAWVGVTAAVATARHRMPGHLPLAPLAVITAIGLVVGVTRLVFYLGVQQSRPHHSGAAAPAAGPALASRSRPAPSTPQHPRRTYHGRPVLVLAGFGSSCCGHAGDVHRVLPGRLVQQFSYRGLTRTGQPIPHGPSASNISLTVLGNRVAAQVRHLHEVTGRRVDVVAESEGTLGVDALLALHPRAPVGSVVLLSPIVAPAQDSYPPLTGGRDGLVAGAALHAMIWFAGGLSPFGTAGAQTFVNSVDNMGARFAAAAHPHLFGSLQFMPLADAVTMPVCPLPGNVDVVPAFHGELLGDPAVLRPVREFLTHRPVHRQTGLRTTAEVIAAGAAAWRMPLITVPSPPCRG
jgi:hypothetical protein